MTTIIGAGKSGKDEVYCEYKGVEGRAIRLGSGAWQFRGVDNKTFVTIPDADFQSTVRLIDIQIGDKR